LILAQDEGGMLNTCKSNGVLRYLVADG